MNKDFHFGIIKVLARAGGFKESEAQIIAYASQHTDDARLHIPLTLKDNSMIKLNKELQAWINKLDRGLEVDKKIVEEHLDGVQFEPVCTAHKDLDYLQGLKQATQRKVYVSFHFVPAMFFTKGKRFSFLTKHGVGAAALLVDKITTILKNNTHTDRNLALIALGIALHSYADTWSHENFSGLKNKNSNDLSSIKIDGKTPETTFQMLGGKIFPCGHIQADNWPDKPQADLKFKWSRKGKNNEIDRNNADHFADACIHILTKIAPINNVDPVDSWQKISKPLIEAMNQEIGTKARIGYMEEDFKKRPITKGISLAYDEMEWERKAINPRFKITESGSAVYKRATKNEFWFKFHMAAAAHRAFVKARIKP